MSLRQTWISILRRRRREDDRSSSPEADVGQLALTDAFVTNDTALRGLLEGDGRDTDDIPGFAALADHQAELVALIASTPAQTLDGLVAKARCARLHPAERGFDAALEISLSLADDLLLIGRLSPSSSSFLRSGPGAAPPQMREQIMNNLSDAGRRAIRRRNENWRQFGQALTMVGGAAVVALVVVLLNGVDLPWIALAGLAATAVGSIGLSFYVLRFIDHSV